MSPDGNSLGATGGAQVVALTEAQLPSLTKTVSVTDPGHAHIQTGGVGGAGSNNVTAAVGNGGAASPRDNSTSSATTGISATVSFGSGDSHGNVQPSLIFNYIIKT